MLIVVLAFAGGLLVGSFLNVVAHRIPLGESIVRPGSRCPGCRTPIRARDNVPVLGWLLLRGRCRTCAEPISARYPLVELATGVLWAAVAAASEPPLLWLHLVLVTVLVPVTLIDLDVRLIPNALLAPAAVAGIVLVLALVPGDLVEHLVAALAALLFFLVAALASPGGMGMGDVKLAGVMGLYLGAAVAVGILVALFTGAAVGFAIMARKGVAAGRKTKIPFGPYLALGGVVAALAGDAVVAAYVEGFA